LIEIFSGQYLLYRNRVGVGSLTTVPFTPTHLPDHHLFSSPPERLLLDTKSSRLDLWKSNYIAVCKASNAKPHWSAVETIDLYLDRRVLGIAKEDKMSELTLREISADDLTLLAESLNQTFQYK
jgi:hypothetical protein